MASNLLAIARSGAQAARAALDVTAQNIANASTDGYVRRSVALAEVAAPGGSGTSSTAALSGVRLSRIVRNADQFRQSEARRTGGDTARADAEVAGLGNVEAAVEQANVYPAIVGFETALRQLAANSVDPSLRSAVVSAAGSMAGAFNLAANSLATAGQGLRFQASDGTAQVDLLTGELARINLRLRGAGGSGSDQSALLDQRDRMLDQLSGLVDISAMIASDQTVDVRLGGTSGPQLAGFGTSSPLAMTTAADGTIAFTLGGSPVTPASGSLTGIGQALVKLRDTGLALDAVAAGVIATVNAAQANGVELNGSAGQPLFAGASAANIAVAFSGGAMLATAPAGAGANSRDPANLAALSQALSTSDPAGAMDAVIFDISSTVAGRTVTRDALASISDAAGIALHAQSGVDLDQEAVDLVRYQQAFQASGRVMQVASDLFDTLLGIR